MTQEPHELPYEPIPTRKLNPFYGLIALFLAILVFGVSLHGYRLLFHPVPKVVIPLIESQELITEMPEHLFGSWRDLSFIQNDMDQIKIIANRIVSRACPGGDNVCQSEATYQFVRDRITYVPDEHFHDALQHPLVTINSGGADCEDMAVLLGLLAKAIGNEARLVHIPGHVYTQIRIPKYKKNWINLDPTCKQCKFGKIPSSSDLQKKDFFEL